MAKILVADDSTMMLQIAKMNLEKLGHTVLQASDGNDAVAKTISEKPELIRGASKVNHKPPIVFFNVFKRSSLNEVKAKAVNLCYVPYRWIAFQQFSYFNLSRIKLILDKFSAC